jgi:hypothetical protein
VRARTLLVGGLVAGPLYLFLALAQAGTREGFDITRHAVSMLALGPGGWVQVANFVMTGLLVLACARRQFVLDDRRYGAFSVFTAGAFLVAFMSIASGPPRPATVIGLWLGLTLTWVWLAGLAWRARQQAVGPRPASGRSIS